MNLTCDLCGNILTETDNDHALCNHCGVEYGPERMRELREAMTPSDPVPPTPQDPATDPAPKSPQKQKSGCGTWFLIIMAILDLLIGTHGIVAVFCLIILFIASKLSGKK